MLGRGWTDDKILSGRVLLRQMKSGFRSGSDAVLLASACHPVVGGRALELGCATGSALLSLGWRRPDLSLTGLEIDPMSADLARFNIRRNGMGERASVVLGDVRIPPLPNRSFDLVLANPPYFTEQRNRRSPDPNRDRARAEGAAGLADWVSAAAELLTPNGHAVFIMRTERQAEMKAAATKQALSTQTMTLVGARLKPAKRMLVKLSHLPDAGTSEPRRLYLHNSDGSESALTRSLLREAAPIFWPDTVVTVSRTDT